MDVKVGGLSDPDDLEGLAHFLEHVLFMGCRSYPGANDFGFFVHQHGGQYNGETEGEYTTYHFNIRSAFLAEGLRRFAALFEAPLFERSAIRSELKVFEAEFVIFQNDDFWRQVAVEKALSTPGHPYCRFVSGSGRTLLSNGLDSLRQALQDFYRQHYSAHLMLLVVRSNRSVQEMQTMLEPFELVQSLGLSFANELLPPLPLPPPLEENRWARLIRFDAGRDKIWMDVTLMVAGLPRHAEYLVELLEGADEGSLLCFLALRGWATKIRAIREEVLGDLDVFRIGIKLTPSGLEQWVEVALALRQYMRMLEVSSETLWLLLCERQKAKEALASCPSPIIWEAEDRSQALAQRLRYYELAELLEANVTATNESFGELLDFIRSFVNENRFRVILSAPSAAHPRSRAVAVEGRSGATYSVHDLPEGLLNFAIAPTTCDQLRLPPTNRYFFADVSGPRPLPRPSSLPVRLHNAERIELWHLGRDNLSAPISTLHVAILLSPTTVHLGPLQSLLKIIKNSLRELISEASRAGASVQVQLAAHGQVGMEVVISGYDQQLPAILRDICEGLRTLEITYEAVNQVRDSVKEHRSGCAQDPTKFGKQVLDAFLSGRLISPSGGDEVQFIDMPSMHQLKLLHLQLLIEGYILCLYDGNVTASEAQAILPEIALLRTVAGGDSVTPSQHAEGEEHFAGNNEAAIELAPHHTVVIPPLIGHDDSSITIYLPTGCFRDARARVYTALFVGLYADAFFDHVRRHWALGYRVSLKEFSSADRVGILLSIQSCKSPRYMQEIVQQFIAALETSLDDLVAQPDLLYQRFGLPESPSLLPTLSTALWDCLLHHGRSFAPLHEETEILQQVSLKSMRQFISTNLERPWKDGGAVTVQVWSERLAPQRRRIYPSLNPQQLTIL